MNYRAYNPQKSWYVVEVIKILSIGMLVGMLFYDSLVGGIVVIFAAPYLWKNDKQRYTDGQKRKLRAEFKDMIVLLSGNLNAGYSLENAFMKVLDEVERMSGDDCRNRVMVSELKYIVNGIHCNRKVEDMLMEFGDRCGIREIQEFAGLIVAAKNYGGNMIHMIRQTAGNMTDTQMVENEISTLTAAKRLEGKIMLITPFVILVYMKITNEQYMQILYTTVLGRVVMSICLGVILAAGIWIEHIMRIEV